MAESESEQKNGGSELDDAYAEERLNFHTSCAHAASVPIHPPMKTLISDVKKLHSNNLCISFPELCLSRMRGKKYPTNSQTKTIRRQ